MEVFEGFVGGKSRGLGLSGEGDEVGAELERRHGEEGKVKDRVEGSRRRGESVAQGGGTVEGGGEALEAQGMEGAP
jgi:hypothetical protein